MIDCFINNSSASYKQSVVHHKKGRSYASSIRSLIPIQDPTLQFFQPNGKDWFILCNFVSKKWRRAISVIWKIFYWNKGSSLLWVYSIFKYCLFGETRLRSKSGGERAPCSPPFRIPSNFCSSFDSELLSLLSNVYFGSNKSSLWSYHYPNNLNFERIQDERHNFKNKLKNI